jgi:superfamily I DNA/RNA helicase
VDILDTLQSEQPSQDFGNASDYQKAYYEALMYTSDNIQLNARAGSGKTTTLTKGAEYLGGDTVVLCFNKSNQVELEAMVKGYAQAKTFNGLGNGLFWRHNRSAVLNANKVREAVRLHLGEGSETYREYGGAVVRAVSLMKSNALGLSASGAVDPEEVSEIFDSYDLGVPEDKLSTMVDVTLEVFRRTNRDYSQFDFDDQLYVPIAMGWDFKRFSNVLVDEDQDLSPIQHLMLQRLVDQGARLLGVGDDRQAIYGFRGALSNSVERLEERFSLKRMPLPICYRCPKRVIKEAQLYVSDIQAAPWADEGIVRYQKDHSEEDPQFFDSETLVLSRTNAPLFKSILRYIRAKRPCRVESNFLESFQGFIRSFKVETTDHLRPLLKDWFEKEKASAEKKGFKGRIAGLTDKFETADLLAREFKRTFEILQLLQQLSKSANGTRFSTVHKAKGTEADDVYILRPDLMPSPFANTKEQMRQEENLLYVAITRAKKSLTWGVSLP